MSRSQQFSIPKRKVKLFSLVLVKSILKYSAEFDPCHAIVSVQKTANINVQRQDKALLSKIYTMCQRTLKNRSK